MLESPIVQLFAAHIWQGLLLLPGIWVLTRLVAKDNPAMRHAIWVAALGLLALLPLLSFVAMPRFVGDWMLNPPVAAEATGPVSAANADPMPVANASEKTSPPAVAPTASTLPLLGVGSVLLFVWLAGLALRLGQFARDLRRSRRLTRLSGLRHVPRNLLPPGWPRRVPVLAGTDVPVPMMVGFARPAVLLPEKLVASLPAAQITPILFHELAHIERRDPWTALIERLLAAIMWWSPWAALVARQIRFERELACDDRAVRRTGSARAYARSLVDGAAQLIAGSERPALALGALYGSNALTERVKRLATRNYVPGGAARRPLMAVAGLAMGLASLSVALATPGAMSEPSDGEDSGYKELLAAVNVSPLQRAFVESAGEVGPEDLAQMIDAGAEIDGFVPGDGTALIVAAQSGRLQNVEFLIERGADVNFPAPGDGNALIAAASSGEVEILERLLDAGADINAAVRGDGNALIAAAGAGRVDMIERLLDAGADIDADVPGDETALITAVRSGRMRAVRALVEAGADVNLGVMASTVLGEEWRSPLGEARKAGRDDIADYLTEHGARPQ